MRITELEREMLTAINEGYSKWGVENTDFYNVFGFDADQNRELRGTFSSLKKKGIVDHYKQKYCFCPIYPNRKYIEVMEEMGAEISKNVYDYVRRAELEQMYGEEHAKWCEENNGYNWRDPEQPNHIYWMYPFDRWLMEQHNIEY